jgi:hypothetical protein
VGNGGGAVVIAVPVVVGGKLYVFKVQGGRGERAPSAGHRTTAKRFMLLGCIVRWYAAAVPSLLATSSCMCFDMKTVPQHCLRWHLSRLQTSVCV